MATFGIHHGPDGINLMRGSVR